MYIARVYTNELNEAVIVCPKCGNSRLLNAAKCKKHLRRLIARCGCGAMFHVFFPGLSEDRRIAGNK